MWGAALGSGLGKGCLGQNLVGGPKDGKASSGDTVGSHGQDPQERSPGWEAREEGWPGRVGEGRKEEVRLEWGRRPIRPGPRGPGEGAKLSV